MLFWHLSVALAGYPVYFASFENVGKSIVAPQTQKFEAVDDQLTEWLTGCNSDIFIVIKDSNPFDAVDLYRIKRHAEQCLTTGSFLTDYPINMFELAEDVAQHCRAPFRRLNSYAEKPTEPEINQRRTYYIEFDSSDRVAKSEFLHKVMQHIWSPYVTIVYGSSFSVESPVFPRIELDPKRKLWTERYSDRYQERPVKDPKIEPLKDIKSHAQRQSEKAAKQRAAQYPDYLPDDQFVQLFTCVLGIVCLMVLKRIFF